MLHRKQQVATPQSKNEAARFVEVEQGRKGGSPMSGGERKKMTCAEFQEVLPYIFESGGDANEMEHLKTCHICSDLVQDLRYIADQAKLLLPLRDPSPKVWDNIQNSLEREGLVRAQAKAHSAGKKKVAEMQGTGDRAQVIGNSGPGKRH